MSADLEEFRSRYHQSVAAFIAGNPDVQKALWSDRDDVTLANPLGPPARGFDGVLADMDRASEQISGGEDYSVDPISSVETADLAYEVAVEHSRVRLAGAAERVPVDLRVTTVFRREDEGWKLVHRHADPITAARPVQSIVRPDAVG